MVLVMVVPILAPIMIGIAPRRETEPEATKATTMEVVVELLCRMAVTSNPMNKPVKGLVVANKIVSAAVFPRYCSEEIIKSRAKKNMSRAPMMYTVFRVMFFHPGDGEVVDEEPEGSVMKL